MNYPYFLPQMIEAYRKADPESPEAHKLALKISVNIGDKETLRRILGHKEQEKPAKKETSSTLETIDNFLSKFAPANMTAQYMPEKPAESTPAEKLKQLIKNQKYTEALEIIEQQNLNNPQKNIYFADQIRFLRKLIDIENKKTRTSAASQP